MNKNQSMASDTIYVDLDHTLINTDMLHESVLLLIKLNIKFLFFIPFWLLKGRAYMKDQIASRVEPRYDLLPYNTRLINYLEMQKANGRKLVLATASNRKFAEGINKHLILFDDIVASDSTRNIKSAEKLKSILAREQNKSFDYVGDSIADHPIFDKAQNIVLVNPSRATARYARKLNKDTTIVETDRVDIKTFIRSARLYQWIKNILIFVPLFTSHNWLNEEMLLLCALGFISFGLCASSIYLINDLFDLEADREHPKKRHRPLAAGTMSITQGAVFSLLLLAASLSMGFYLGQDFFIVLVSYIAITTTYTLSLKRIVVIDAITLAALFTIRVVAGAQLIDVSLSFWLIAFSIFIFFSLSLVKRCSELITLKKDDESASKGRDYNVSDLFLLQIMGICSGFLSVLVVALYINDPTISTQYTNHRVLWLICPLLLYWISRMWLKTARGEMHSDPIIFAIKDRASLLTVLLILTSSIMAL